MRALPDVGRLLRFGLTGLMNTALSCAVILAVLAAGHGDVPANLAGYAAGLALSFVLNARWTFASASGFEPGVATRYAFNAILAYGANLAVVILVGSMVGPGNLFAHLAGMGVYSCLFYWGSVRFVFVAPARAKAVR